MKTPDLQEQLKTIAKTMSELASHQSSQERSKEFRRLSKEKNAIIAQIEKTTKL